MNNILYSELKEKLSEDVKTLNKERGLLEKLKGRKYSLVFPFFEKSHNKPILVIYNNNCNKHTIAEIEINEKDNSLEGLIIDFEERAVEKLRETIHLLSHKYGIRTGDLLE